MSDRTTTLSAVISAANASTNPKGEWADEFVCVVKRADPPQGKVPSKARIYDPANGSEAALAWFGGDLREFVNQTCVVGGKGNSAKNYRGAVEITIGKNGTIVSKGAAPQQPAPAAPSGATPPSGANPPPPVRSKVDPTTYFHKEMSKAALLWAHCYQYALNTEPKVVGEGNELPADWFQALVSSLFIRADRAGLMDHVPALRSIDDKGLPLRYIPPQPDPAVLEAEKKRKAAEAEAQRKAQEAEDAAIKAREAALHTQHHPQENVDEDVPF
jgi:hypothetical protein